MEIPHRFTTIGCAFGLACGASVLAVEPPGPKPTPRPGTLAALASSRTLNRGPGTGRTGIIVITDDNLATLGQGAAVTIMTSTIAETVPVDQADRADPDRREKWRRKVLSQSTVIAKLEAKREDAEANLNRLERGRLDGRALDRIAKAETKLKTIDAEIGRAEAQLSRIIRDARKEGAQPGWFR